MAASSAKLIFHPRKKLENDIIPDFIKNALAKRIHNEIKGMEQNIRALEVEMESRCSLINAIKFQAESEILQEYKVILKNCSEMGDSKADKKEACKEKLSQFQLKEAYKENLSQFQLKVHCIYFRIDYCEKVRVNARADEIKDSAIKDPETAKYLVLAQQAIMSIAKPLLEQSPTTPAAIARLIEECEKDILKNSIESERYNQLRTEYAEKISHLKDSCNIYLSLLNECKQKTLTLENLQKKRRTLDDLVFYEANAKDRDEDGFTPLHYACLLGDFALIKKLVNEYGTNKFIKSHSGCFPFQLLTMHDFPHTKDMLSFLLPPNFYSEDFFKKDTQNRTLLESAVFYRNSTMVNILTSSMKALVDSSDEIQHKFYLTILSALHHAVIHGYNKIVKTLIPLMREIPQVRLDDIYLILKDAYCNGRDEVAREFFRQGFSLGTIELDSIKRIIVSLPDEEKLSLIQKIERCEKAIADEQEQRLFLFSRLAMATIKHESKESKSPVVDSVVPSHGTAPLPILRLTTESPTLLRAVIVKPATPSSTVVQRKII